MSGLQQPGDPYGLTVLIVKAGRIADRLAKLDDPLSGEQTLWCRLRENHQGDIYVSVDSALGEARPQATVLRHPVATERHTAVVDDESERSAMAAILAQVSPG
jgi:hypothetical protein